MFSFLWSWFLFYLINVTGHLFTDVLESIPLLSRVSAYLHIPESGKHRVSNMTEDSFISVLNWPELLWLHTYKTKEKIKVLDHGH